MFLRFHANLPAHFASPIYADTSSRRVRRLHEARSNSASFNLSGGGYPVSSGYPKAIDEAMKKKHMEVYGSGCKQENVDLVLQKQTTKMFVLLLENPENHRLSSVKASSVFGIWSHMKLILAEETFYSATI